MNAFRSRVGSIDWVDLSTPDADGGCAFYAKVLGWTFERSETPMGVYHVASVGGHQARGVMVGGPPNGAPPMWTVFVRVADIDETSGAVANARQHSRRAVRHPRRSKGRDGGRSDRRSLLADRRRAGAR